MFFSYQWADVGGIRSHSAIVSRKYGIPVITGIGNSTLVVTIWAVIKVNGDANIAEIACHYEMSFFKDLFWTV